MTTIAPRLLAPQARLPGLRAAALARRIAAELPPEPWLPLENRLLANLPRKDCARMLAALEPVTLQFGEPLHDRGDAIRLVHFPGTALISLLAIADGHVALEVGLVGREGMVDVALALGAETAGASALVQGSGSALRMSAAQFRKEFRRSLPLQQGIYRYASALMAQIAQTAACNHFHVVEQRLARWLLMSSDRLGLDHFRMTHEFLGHMLGVRRVGVTEAATHLQKGKLIMYHRGDITILDRHGLEAAACGCYALVKAIYDESRPAELGHLPVAPGAGVADDRADDPLEVLP
jgi:CRP-like cAMP-binding protein